MTEQPKIPSVDLTRVQVNRVDELKKLLSNFRKDSAARKTKTYFAQRLKRLEQLHADFQQTHARIIGNGIDGKHMYLSTEVYSAFDEIYLDVYCEISDRQDELFSSKPNADVPPNPSTHSVSSIPMPNLPIPTFSGKFTDWPSFYDAFNRLIHANSDLNEIQKFHYLKRALPSDHDIDLHQMSLTETNYETAWNLLIKRYDNPRILFTHHMNALYSLPKLQRERADDIKFMLNAANVCINELRRLKIFVDDSKFWVVHHLVTRLPKETHQAWEHHLSDRTTIPNFSDLEAFLYTRLHTLDAIENRLDQVLSSDAAANRRHNQAHTFKRPQLNAQHVSSKSFHIHTKLSNASTKVDHCALCGQMHILRRCQTFLNKDCFERKTFVDAHKICSNCLSPSHGLSHCTSARNCMQCGKRHHTLLHIPATQHPNAQNQQSPHQVSLNASTSQSANDRRTAVPSAYPANSQHASTTHAFATHSTTISHAQPSTNLQHQRRVLLATALVKVQNFNTGESAVVRALLDQGSEGTIISENVVQALRLKKTPNTTEILGVGANTKNRCHSSVNLILRSCTNSDFNIFVDVAYVLNSITTCLPTEDIIPQSWPHLQGLTLADPYYGKSSKVEMLIGADLFAKLILPGLRVGSHDEPIAQNTHFGWILSGSFVQPAVPRMQFRCCHATLELEKLVKQFYELEQVPSQRILSDEDKWCEEFFQQTHTRLDDGTYMVRLPLKSLFDPNQTLGRSKQTALNRFHQLERRLTGNADFGKAYTSAIEDYFRLQQLTPATSTENQNRVISSTGKPTFTSCVLPHHAVIKAQSCTTKLRVVYDASSKTSNGKSLNDLLCIGPSLQNDLTAVILNWRKHKYVFTADIQKMYRCIRMHPDDAQYQRILWRGENHRIQEFCLKTVTFGTASAPFTAIRVLHQIAQDEKHRFPLAENVLRHEMYVDDVQTGSHILEEAVRIREQLRSALLTAGMELRKWASNSEVLVRSIPPEHRSQQGPLQIHGNEAIKTLGLYWTPTTDSFNFRMNSAIEEIPTKRSILSTIARLFDPLGFLTPVIVAAKIVLKSVWTTEVCRPNGSPTALEWDEIIPTPLCERWQQVVQSLADIHRISIPRYINFVPQGVVSVELHTFCDGSSSAYAACTYIRLQYLDGTIHTHLLAAKSKVTPVKPLTIPRVELCGAMLGATLGSWIKGNLRIPNEDVSMYFWTDAIVVLCWIRGDMNRWKTFVANRVSKILSITAREQWNHVSTLENPADCASRGITVNEMLDLKLWWKGPRWLSKSRSVWPKYIINSDDVDAATAETKPTQVRIHMAIQEDAFICKYSSLNHLIRINALLLRFSFNTRPVHRDCRRTGPLSTGELQASLYCLVRRAQAEEFHEDLRLVKANESVPHKSNISSLTPFLDEEGILRVGGRLQRALLPYNQRHPIILPKAHHLTRLVIENAHKATLHGGIQLTTSYLRQRFWIVHARKTVQQLLRKCITCFRNKPKVASQLMGNLPLQRVNPPARPFYATGVDFTGAIELKASRFRGNTVYKGYIAVFICLATKAVHLEAVTGLSTECFLAALQRFIGRRGICHDIYSDCGTNFVGADKALRHNQHTFAEAVKRDIIPELTMQNIQWHFNPPYSPNFGGIWEANVKSVKYHLKRTIDSTRLTYEALSTVLVRIEACLNSRPMCPLTADPDDLLVLTPGHFLIGDSLLAPPESTINTPGISTHYLALQRMTQQFWKKWSSDWLSHLQARPKWRKHEANLQINELVLIKDDRLPPQQWMLGRVVELHPGVDNLVRVATLRTKLGMCKRSISKLCRLPISSNTESATITNNPNDYTH